MTTFLRLTLAVLFLVSLSSPTRAEDEAPSPDLSTPKKALISLFELSMTGRVSEFQMVFVAPVNDDERNLLDYGMSDDVYVPLLHKVIKAKFADSPDAQRLSDMSVQFPKMKKQVEEKWEEQINGDTATVRPPGSKDDRDAIQFKKVDQEWRMLIVPGSMLRKLDGPQLELAKAQKAAYVETAMEVEAGKYATVSEATQACDKRRREAFELYQKASKPHTNPPEG